MSSTGSCKTTEFAGGSRIISERVHLGRNFKIGSDVIIECGELIAGDDVSIGMPEGDAFRYPGGVRIRAERLVLGPRVRIERHVSIRGGNIELGPRVRIAAGCTLHVRRRLAIASGGVVNEHCEIAGVDIEIGRQLWMLPHAKIGGGSCFEVHSQFRAGNWLHIGARSFLNTARPITIGHEVGLGTATSLYTHGAYPSALDGKPAAFGPISIGDRTWIPGAIVNPNVQIGADCVVAVGSVVTKSIPDGSLAGGVPAAVIKEKAYPRQLSPDKRYAFFADFLKVFTEICSDTAQVDFRDASGSLQGRIGDALIVFVPELTAMQIASVPKHSAYIFVTDRVELGLTVPAQATLIDCMEKRVVGPATPLSERLLNQLRRYGVRFNYDADEGRYIAWQ